MYKFGFLCLGLIWAGCNSTHKLTGTDYVDITTESAPEIIEGYPSSIVDEAGWNDITAELKDKKDYEEFRIWLKSKVYPGYLFKLTMERKTIEGEGILYWDKSNPDTQDSYVHAEMMQYLDGICTEFFQVDNYGYCFPEYEDDMSWASAYHSIERQNFWQIAEGPNIEIDENNKDWSMYVQARLGNYYRDYAHRSPEKYEDGMLKNKVRSLSGAVKLITNKFRQNSITNLFEGVTDGTSFTLCDSSEVWEFKGNLNSLLSRAGLKTSVNLESGKTLYYITVKGRVTAVWYNEWANSDYDRKLTPTDVYDIRAVSEIKCPQKLTTR